jgi:hypothetical protein
LQAKKDRFLVREVLIERPDADAGGLGDADRREAMRAYLLKNANRGLQDGVDEVRRALLDGLFAG